ncbi:MAG: hypothetical protein E5Y73_11095 [Mesorhizobium sp.]|uniref:hypothetical protein n=1 Tax=Mesorhizobium sp. TaxID=1871066 RepID=UPI00120CB5C7|nr:hypothetical protein [Mesorhizobium sp.]TIL94648.1 MAG: hypothetical protein E5Y73_11095 [Mesorhizobium sp.]
MNAHARHVTGAKAISVQTLARQMFTEADGDLNKATDKFIGYIANFPRLAEEVLREGALKLLRDVPSADKQVIGRASCSSVKSGPYRETDGARRARGRLLKRSGQLKDLFLTWPVTIGNIVKPLRDWLGVEVASHGETQLISGASQVRNARWLIAVGRAAGDKRIGDALKEEQVARLKSEAEGSDV